MNIRSWLCLVVLILNKVFTDSFKVIDWLEDVRLDITKLSGGTYERPNVFGLPASVTEERQAGVNLIK